jgi:hypothetical protein
MKFSSTLSSQFSSVYYCAGLKSAGPITKPAQIYKYTNTWIEDNYINKTVTKSEF